MKKNRVIAALIFATFLLSSCSSSNSNSTPFSPETISYSEQLVKDARQGNPSAQRDLGYCYVNGLGVEQNIEKAFSWLIKAANQDDADAQDLLGTLYMRTHNDYHNAFKWCSKAAEKGHVKGQYHVGVLYESCSDLLDLQKAVQWFTKAAHKGYNQAQYKLGLCYMHGCGVAQNKAEGFKWLLKGAEGGDNRAQYLVGSYYVNAIEGAHEEVVNVDVQKGLMWLTAAANQGNQGAIQLLGNLYYEFGKLEAAAELGHPEAIKQLGAMK